MVLQLYNGFWNSGGEKMKHVVALRMDDVGASSKKYEVYSNFVWKVSYKGQTLRYKGRKLKFPVGNWLFLKYLRGLKAWGPYREMTAQEWAAIYRLLEQFEAKLTVGVTAAWVESEQQLIPFPERFPEEASMLKEGVQQGLLEIANHGLSHCVLRKNAFKPKWFRSNREQHREFWDWLPPNVHEEHLRRAQDILQTYFQTQVVTFIPPGNVFADATLEAAQKYGLRYVSCKTAPGIYQQLRIIGNQRVLPFHDRDLVLNGVIWLEQLLRQYPNTTFCFVKDLEHRSMT